MATYLWIKPEIGDTQKFNCLSEGAAYLTKQKCSKLPTLEFRIFWGDETGRLTLALDATQIRILNELLEEPEDWS